MVENGDFDLSRGRMPDGSLARCHYCGTEHGEVCETSFWSKSQKKWTTKIVPRQVQTALPFTNGEDGLVIVKPKTDLL